MPELSEKTKAEMAEGKRLLELRAQRFAERDAARERAAQPQPPQTEAEKKVAQRKK